MSEQTEDKKQELREKALALLADIDRLHTERASTGKVNFLLYGQVGSGKTYALSTLPGTTLIDSFDQGGTKTIKRFMSTNKNIHVDSKWEQVPTKNPGSLFSDWSRTFEERDRSKLFENITNYCIDSGTGWSDALMYSVQKLDAVGKKFPTLPEFGVHQIQTLAWLKRLLELPCNFILTAHVEVRFDEVDNKSVTSLATYGGLKVKIPRIFDEIYYTQVKEGSAGAVRSFLTENDGRFMARTRIGGGILKKEEAPDFTSILTRTGYYS